MSEVPEVKDSAIKAAQRKAITLLKGIDDPKIKEMVTNGLLFSKQGYDDKTILQAYSPLIAEAMIDFTFNHLNDDVDTEARKLAHAAARDFVKQGIKLNTGDIVTHSDADVKHDSAALNRLLEVQKALALTGSSVDEVIKNNKEIDEGTIDATV